MKGAHHCVRCVSGGGGDGVYFTCEVTRTGVLGPSGVDHRLHTEGEIRTPWRRGRSLDGLEGRPTPCRLPTFDLGDPPLRNSEEGLRIPGATGVRGGKGGDRRTPDSTRTGLVEIQAPHRAVAVVWGHSPPVPTAPFYSTVEIQLSPHRRWRSRKQRPTWVVPTRRPLSTTTPSLGAHSR